MLLMAQADTAGAEKVVMANIHFTELIGHLLPISLSPYLTLFATSLLAKLGYGADFFQGHPLFNSYLVMGFSLLLFGITMVPKLFSKVAAPITLTANFLDNKASIIIVLIITLLPSLIGPQTETMALNVQFGALGDLLLPFEVVIIAAVAVIYIVVVMTVRLFLEILIMLSPVPLIDTIFEFAKIGMTLLFILLGVFFPNFAFGIAVIAFLISLVMYRKATRTIAQIRFLIIAPVINFIFRRKGELISKKLPYAIKKEVSNPILAIPVFNQTALGDIPKNKSVWLVKDQDKLILAHAAFLRGVKQHDISGESQLKLTNNIMNLALSNGETIKLVISKSYLVKKQELEQILGCQPETDSAEQEEGAMSKGFKRFLSFFDFKTILANKKMLLGKQEW